MLEDDPPVRGTVRKLLERHGYVVLDAANGEDALALVAARGAEIDLVVSDIVMPGMSGMELANRLRAMSPSIPVLLVSGYTEEAISRAGDGPRDEQIIEKPFSVHTMLEKVRGALAAQHRASQLP